MVEEKEAFCSVSKNYKFWFDNGLFTGPAESKYSSKFKQIGTDCQSKYPIRIGSTIPNFGGKSRYINLREKKQFRGAEKSKNPNWDISITFTWVLYDRFFRNAN